MRHPDRHRGGTQKELSVPLDEELDAHLEQVQEAYGLADKDDAAELLLKRRLRKGVRGITGRGPAIYPIAGGKHGKR